MARVKFTGATGLPLARRAVRALKDRGIFAHALLSVEQQQLARRYVLRGLESGGSLGDLGRYVTFADEQGGKLEYLQPVESIAVNGLHAVVISTRLVRVDLLRKGWTYELLITSHKLGPADIGNHPLLETQILFRGVHGRLELDLCGRDRPRAGSVAPSFLSLGGEPVTIPEEFVPAVWAATKGVNCAGCAHSHYLRRPAPSDHSKPKATSPITVET